jgi:hypothetical protein
MFGKNMYQNILTIFFVALFIYDILFWGYAILRATREIKGNFLGT